MKQVAQLWLTDRATAYIRKVHALCSCQHCQWFCAGRDAVAIRRTRITRPKRNLPNAYKILVTRYDQLRTGVGHFRRMFHRKGGVAHQPLCQQN